MANYSKQIIGRQAKELGFIRDTLEKVLRLVEILQFFEDDSLLAESLALKGGTAINLTIFDLPRLSVDIDLDYCRETSREGMFEDRELINERIKRYMTSTGYHLSEKSKNYHSLDSMVYSYINCGGMNDNIKIEINYSLRHHILPLVNREIVNNGFFPKAIVRSVAAMEIFGSKIVALLSRTAARDLYDINNMIAYGLFNNTDKSMLRKCAFFYFAVGSPEIPERIDFNRIDTMTYFKIRTELVPVISKKYPFDLAAAQKGAKSYLSDLLVPTEREMQFIDEFRKKIYRPELLFEDSDIVSRIKNHPMALWKMQHE